MSKAQLARERRRTDHVGYNFKKEVYRPLDSILSRGKVNILLL
jgi:hypothetical protein